jgi:hypothetical protein
LYKKTLHCNYVGHFVIWCIFNIHGMLGCLIYLLSILCFSISYGIKPPIHWILIFYANLSVLMVEMWDEYGKSFGFNTDHYHWEVQPTPKILCILTIRRTVGNIKHKYNSANQPLSHSVSLHHNIGSWKM